MLWGAVAHNIDATQSIVGLRTSDVLAVPLPCYYSYGLSMVNLAVRNGAKASLLDFRQPPVALLRDILEHDPDALALIPTQLRLLLARHSFSARSLQRLRMLLVAGGPLNQTDIAKLREVFPDVAVFVLYGQTEAGPRISILPSELFDSMAPSIGNGIPGFVEVSLTNPASGTEPGEVLVRSRSLMVGYTDPNLLSPIDANGWLHTGDIGVQDAESGLISITGRASPFFKPGAERVAFAEIEEIIRAVLPDVGLRFEVISDERLGETVTVTLVEPRGVADYDFERLKANLFGQLGAARAPREVKIETNAGGNKF